MNKQDELPVEYSNSEGWKSYTYGSSPTYYYTPGDYKYIDVNGDGLLIITMRCMSVVHYLSVVVDW